MSEHKKQIPEPFQVMGLGLFMTTIGALLLVALNYIWMDEKSAHVQGTKKETQIAQGYTCAINEQKMAAIKSAAKGHLAAFIPMDEPYSIAQFKFTDSEGNARSLADWNGQSALVNLWATWCAPCRAEMPSLDMLQSKLGSESFEVIPISVDKSEPDKPMAFFKEISINAMGFFHDRNADTLNTLKRDGLALGLPATLLIDNNGCVLGRLNGPAEWDSLDAQNLIKSSFNHAWRA